MSVSPAGFEIARVVAIYKESYTVSNGENETLAELVGKLIYSAASQIEFTAAGDWVFASFYDNNTFTQTFFLSYQNRIDRRQK